MAEPVLVLLAAGMGSRYGGLKQIDPVDEAGNLIIDFSIHDAIKAGFKELVFIIKDAIAADFKEAIGERMARHAGVKYAYQEMDKLPEGFSVPEGRVKPWGTTHAVLCAREEIAGRPFAVINSDDYYGPEAFRRLYAFLSAPQPEGEHLMIGYKLENTLTDHGSVARGVCAVDENGYLSHIVERRRVIKQGEGGAFTEDGEHYTPIPAGTPVSMNCWGFQPCILPQLEKVFIDGFPEGVAGNPEKYEDLLPNAVQAIMSAGEGRVQVQNSSDRWFGVTYKEDKPVVVANIAALKAAGVYSDKLWE